MASKKMVLIFCMFLLAVPFCLAKNFNVTSNGDSLFFVNGKIYEDRTNVNIDMSPSDSSGSLDDFFLGGCNG